MISSLGKRLCFTITLLVTAVFSGLVLAQDKPVSPCDSMDFAEVEQVRKDALCVDIKVESGNPFSGNCEAIIRGACRYSKWCIACHGPKADGVARFGKYAADLTRHWRGYGEFVGITLNGSKGRIGMMPPWKAVLDPTQISQIGAYLETLADPKKAYWK